MYWANGRLWFIDLLSSNGTEKRGRRCDAERLRVGRTIKLGDVRLGFAHTSYHSWQDTSTESAHEESLLQLDAPLLSIVSNVESSDQLPKSTGPSAVVNLWGSEPSDESDSDADLMMDPHEVIEEMRSQFEEKQLEWEEERQQQQRDLSQQAQTR